VRELSDEEKARIDALLAGDVSKRPAELCGNGALWDHVDRLQAALDAANVQMGALQAQLDTERQGALAREEALEEAWEAARELADRVVELAELWARDDPDTGPEAEVHRRVDRERQHWITRFPQLVPAEELAEEEDDGANPA
jgi:hypothetical protein